MVSNSDFSGLGQRDDDIDEENEDMDDGDDDGFNPSRRKSFTIPEEGCVCS